MSLLLNETEVIFIKKFFFILELTFESLFNTKFFIRCPVSSQSRILIENESFTVFLKIQFFKILLKNIDVHLPISIMTHDLKNFNLLTLNLNNISTFNLKEICFMPKDLKAFNQYYIRPTTMYFFTKTIFLINLVFGKNIDFIFDLFYVIIDFYFLV
jgi:hypothetical protein